MTGRPGSAGRHCVAALATVWLAGALFMGCSGSSSGDGGVPLAAGAVAGANPDLRTWVVDGTTSELRVIDGNNLTQSGVSEAVDLGGADAGRVALDPNGDRFWITLPGTDSVTVRFTFDMSEADELAVGDTPGAVVVDGAGGKAFVANEADDTVTVFDADPPFAEDGASPLAVGDAPVDAVICDDSLVVANRDDDTISVYDIDTLTPVAGSPFAVGDAPIDLVVDEAEGIVFILNRDDGSISVYDEDTMIVTTPVVGLTQPVQMARHGRNDLLFVAERSTGDVRVFTSAATPTEDSDSPVSVGGTLTGISVNGFIDRVLVSVASAGLVQVLSGTAPFADQGSDVAVGTAPGWSLAIEPILERTLISGDGGTAQGSWLYRGRLFMAHGTDGLAILDDDPRATFSAAEITTLATPGSAEHVLVQDGWAFIANGLNGVQIADVEVITDPVIERTVDGIGTVDELFLVGRYLLVDVGASGMSVIDVAAPLLAEEIASASPGGGGTGADYSIEHGLFYLASGTTPDFRVVDVTDIEEPVSTDTVDVPVGAKDVAVLSDRVVAVAAAEGGLRTVQVAPDDNSFLLGQLDLGASVDLVTSFNSHFVLATDENNDLHWVVAQNPEHMFEVGIIELPATPNEVAVFSNELYISLGASGLAIYRFFP